MRSLIILIILLGIDRTYTQTCRTVAQGSFYSSAIPFYGLNSASVITTQVQFNPNTAHYLFSPTDPNGKLCSVSWNKLWGATRCGYFSDNHKDSDRFAWRRAGSCLIFNSAGNVIGETANCSEANLIELSAYAYDNGLKPFENDGTLLKTFALKVQVNVWYKLILTFSNTQTVYQLADSAGVVLETQTIAHRSCSSFSQGSYQSLYFGGQCPAPQAVTVCYK